MPYLLASDYFVLGSYDEMYSLSMIDAMMAGCFVIGTNNGGHAEQQHALAFRETGWLSVGPAGGAENLIPQHNTSAVEDFFEWCK